MILITGCFVVLSIVMTLWYIHTHSHLQRAWDTFIDSWHKCKYEIHFNNVKLENIRRSQDDSRHKQKEILKYIRRIYRSQSPEQRNRYIPKAPHHRRSSVFVVHPTRQRRRSSVFVVYPTRQRRRSSVCVATPSGEVAVQDFVHIQFEQPERKRIRHRLKLRRVQSSEFVSTALEVIRRTASA